MRFDNEYFNLGYLDTLSYRDTAIHRLDPRTKLICTVLFIVAVVSFPKYELKGLLPFFLFPVLIFSFGDIPVKFIMKKVILVSSFALFIGIFNPLLDRQHVTSFFGVGVTGGWISFLSIMLKFFLTITSALLLVATTSFPGICFALQRVGVPEILVSQLLFLYRYLFVLTEETMRITRARDMRSYGRKGRGMKTFVNLAGTLFLRTIERAERIYRAMLSRGFTGTLHTSRPHQLSFADAVFFAATSGALYFFRMHDMVEALGKFSMRIF